MKKAIELIRRSKAQWEIEPVQVSTAAPPLVFSAGARWMAARMNKNAETVWDNTVNFQAFGVFKYGVSFIAFGLAIYFFGRVSLFLTPLAVPVFYLAEVHFLFLFPLLIDGVGYPVWASIRQTYKIGILRAWINVMPIGAYMIIGLLNTRNAFRNWYIGCLAILIWYDDEVRNRL
jgi:hypothetical protein